MPKPSGAAGWTDGRWHEFSGEMGALVRTYRKDGFAALALLIMPLGLLILVAGLMMPNPPMIMRIIHVPFFFLAFVVFITLNSIMKPANQQIDEKIQALCRRYSDGAVQLQYVTLFTGVCKPKGAQTYRSLWVSPAGGMGGGMGQPAFGQPMQPALQAVAPPAGTMMQVTCPAGCKAGDTVAIMAPNGQQVQVQIPMGVAPGQNFNVQLPAAPPVVAATVVSAVPVGMHTA